jgi:hypothetical protein
MPLEGRYWLHNAEVWVQSYGSQSGIFSGQVERECFLQLIFFIKFIILPVFYLICHDPISENNITTVGHFWPGTC